MTNNFAQYVQNELEQAFADEGVREVTISVYDEPCTILTFSLGIIHCEDPDNSNASIYINTSHLTVLTLTKVFK